MADVVASAMVGVPAGLGQPAAELALNGDGAVRRFPAIWLRDNCPCPQCKDPHSGQKLFGIRDLPENIAKEAEFIMVEFKDRATFQK